MTVNFLREELSALATSAHKRGSRLQLRVDVQNVSGSFHLDVFGQGMDHHYTGMVGGAVQRWKLTIAIRRRDSFILYIGCR